MEVKDSGVGISEEDQALVFRQYYMAGTKNQSSSFGLGLYISKLFAQQLDGTIDLISVLEQGSTFTLSVPIKKIKKIDSEQQKYVLDDLPDLNMVVIEDNRINILYLKNYFKNFPKVHIFENGAAALAYMEEQPVDIVITDLHMNELDGWEILSRIRSNPAWTDIRVFVFTADSMYMEMEQQNHQIYFDAKLKKPMDAHDLISCIKDVNRSI
ncbi:Aerobic respiration control sensor protein ArcB [compost metagenome]